MDWQEEYKRKLVSADEAVTLVKSGDRVEISIFPTPSLLPPALHKRRASLRGVETVMPEPVYPMPWFEPGYEESFSSTLELHVGMGGARPVVDEKRADYYPILFSLWHKPYIDRPESAPPMDVFMCTVSPPDRNGYCSFGGHLWNKRVLASHAKIVLAEVDETFIRTHGTNYIHVSDIDRFVENRPELMPDDELERIIQDMPDEEGSRELRAVSTRVEVERRYDFIPKLALMDGPTIRGWAQVYGYQSETEPIALTIGKYVAELIPDGSCLQVGGGTPSTLIPGMGVLDEKHDLGVHSEMSARGLVELVRKGVVTGKRKNFHPGKYIVSALTACTQDEIRFTHNNPNFELYDSHYVVNIANVAGKRQHGLHQQRYCHRPDRPDHLRDGIRGEADCRNRGPARIAHGRSKLAGRAGDNVSEIHGHGGCRVAYSPAARRRNCYHRDTGFCRLRCNGIRCGQSFGQDVQAAGRGADKHRTPGLQGRVEAGGPEALLPVIS